MSSKSSELLAQGFAEARRTVEIMRDQVTQLNRAVEQSRATMRSMAEPLSTGPKTDPEDPRAPEAPEAP